jgi:hypothetical protein
VWIGDWHTHPVDCPSPSAKDLATYGKLLEDPELRFRRFLSIIVSPRDGVWEVPRMRAWLVDRSRVDEARIT